VKIYPEAIESTKAVIKNLNGRSADGGISLPWLGSMVATAGPGDHLDIGSLFGASAIVAALTKKELGHEGKVICLDPYEPRDEHIGGNMPPEKLNGSPEELMANAEAFDVEIELVQAKSQPWPEELEDATFSSAFIDGDHMGETPYLDFMECAKRTSGFIGIDNFEEEYDDVAKAVYKVMQEREWFLHYKNHIFAAFRRTLPRRSEGTPHHVT
jgi:predicted O-methyltransferase YrrM